MRARFPHILQVQASTAASVVPFTFACDDGWFPLIADHFASLQTLVAQGRIDQSVASEVKQKFGQLIVRLANPNPLSMVFAEQVRLKSAIMCELCGSPGLLRWYAGVKTLCEDHAPFGTPVVYPQPTWQTHHVA